MDDSFVTLATLVRGTRPATSPPPPQPVEANARVPFANGAFVRELALMKLAALEAVEGALETFLRRLADEVLARELCQSPADIGALVKRALAQFAEHEPFEIALCAIDAERTSFPIPVRVDPALGPGDLIVVVRDGTIESTFAFRLESVLAHAVREAGA